MKNVPLLICKEPYTHGIYTSFVPNYLFIKALHAPTDVNRNPPAGHPQTAQMCTHRESPAGCHNSRPGNARTATMCLPITQRGAEDEQGSAQSIECGPQQTAAPLEHLMWIIVLCRPVGAQRRKLQAGDLLPQSAWTLKSLLTLDGSWDRAIKKSAGHDSHPSGGGVVSTAGLRLTAVLKPICLTLVYLIYHRTSIMELCSPCLSLLHRQTHTFINRSGNFPWLHIFFHSNLTKFDPYKILFAL